VRGLVRRAGGRAGRFASKIRASRFMCRRGFLLLIAALSCWRRSPRDGAASAIRYRDWRILAHAEGRSPIRRPCGLGQQCSRSLRPLDDRMAIVRSLSHQLLRPFQPLTGSTAAVQGPGAGPGEQGLIALGLLLDLRLIANPRRLGRRPRQPALALLRGVPAVVPGPGIDGFCGKPWRADFISPAAGRRRVHLPAGWNENCEHVVRARRAWPSERSIRLWDAHGPGAGRPDHPLAAGSIGLAPYLSPGRVCRAVVGYPLVVGDQGPAQPAPPAGRADPQPKTGTALAADQSQSYRYLSRFLLLRLLLVPLCHLAPGLPGDREPPHCAPASSPLYLISYLEPASHWAAGSRIG
jgi:hypothetical protein